MYQWLSEAIDNDSLVITASRRLTRVLKSAYDEQQLALGHKAWRSPNISFIGDWLAMVVNSTPESLPLLLSDHASIVVWERCLGEESKDRPLHTRSLARQAGQSWRRLHEWRVPLEDVSKSARSDDERLFAYAARNYRAVFADNDWIDGAQAPGHVAQFISDGTIVPTGAIVHAGFDRVAPAVEQLFSVMKERGCTVSAARENTSIGKPAITAFDNVEAELRSAGAWARQILFENPSARIGIVYLSLDEQATAAERYVREGIAPGWQYGDAGLRTSVNTSYGRRLSEYPAIAVALLALRWLHRGLSFPEISTLLRSKFIAGDDLTGRCKLELYLRQLPDQSWSPSAIVRLFKDWVEETDAALWIECIDRLGSLRSDASRKESPVVWAETIDRLMQALKWPGTGTLASDEYQLINRWRELLNEVARLDIVSPKMTFTDAIRSLTVMAHDTVFQPRSESAVVQLLGPLEAAGMRFDALWIAGLEGDAWPPAAHPLALVSRQLQKIYSMPDATPDDTLDYSNRVLKRLVCSADNVHLSWAKSTDDAEKTASPLIAKFGVITELEGTDPGWHAADLVARQSIEHPENDRAPAVQKDETIAGGAYIVQRQASNPFSAFAYGRLGVAELDSAAAGLSPKMRGSLLHSALHELYADKPSQAEILQWTNADLGKRVNRAVEAALKKYYWFADTVLRRILEFERDRLCNLLHDFVARETQRSTFRVDGVECDLEFEQSGVHLKIRPDRIDRLADDSLLIADYKSGVRQSLVGRSGEIKDLQLAVYACAIGENIGALSLIHIDSRSIDYDSAGGSEEWDSKRADQWSERLSAWRERVTRAMQEIAVGDTRMNLKLKTTEARPLNVLCRFEERKRG